MFIPFSFLALLTLFSSPVVRAGFSIQTPNFTQVTPTLTGRILTNGPPVLTLGNGNGPQCAPVNLSWDNTTGPYDILIANQSNQCGYAVADLGEFTNNYATWTVALPANWSVVISLEDGHSDEAWSQPILVLPSGNTSCLPPDLAALPNAHFVPSTPTSSAGGGRATASTKPSKNDAPSTRQIPSCGFLLSTIGIITCGFFAL